MNIVWIVVKDVTPPTYDLWVGITYGHSLDSDTLTLAITADGTTSDAFFSHLYPSNAADIVADISVF